MVIIIGKLTTFLAHQFDSFGSSADELDAVSFRQLFPRKADFWICESRTYLAIIPYAGLRQVILLRPMGLALFGIVRTVAGQLSFKSIEQTLTGSALPFSR